MIVSLINDSKDDMILFDPLGALTPKLEKVIHILEWVRIEDFAANGVAWGVRRMSAGWPRLRGQVGIGPGRRRQG